MSFDLFKHYVKIQNQRIEEAQAERIRKEGLFRIAQAILHNSNAFAIANTPFTDAGAGEKEVNLFYANSHLNIVVESEDRFLVTKTTKNSISPQIFSGETLNKEDMLTKIVDFVKNQG